MKTKKQNIIAALAVFFLFSGILSAGENLWVYTTGTDTRPEGSWELKLDSISRIDKGDGSYMFNDFRPELEYGITDRWTVAASAIIFRHDYDVGDSGDLDPVQGDHRKTTLAGMELSTKYNILSPYKDFMGLSIGFSYEYLDRYRLDGGVINQHSFIPTIYLQKNFLDDTLVFAFKGKTEFEFRNSTGVREEEFALDLAAGVSYRIAPKWFIGWEVRYQTDFVKPLENGVTKPGDRTELNDFDDFTVGDQFQYGLYTGPSVHYAEEGWWVTVGCLFLVHGGGNNDNAGVDKGGMPYDEHEKYHVGVTLGFEF